MKAVLALVLSASLMAIVHAEDGASADMQRYHALINELRCLVCQNQTIADSNAPLAADLREQVRSQIAAGRSDAEIKAYMTERYGDFVLYRPPLSTHTVLLWIGPFLLLGLGLILALALFRRRPTASRQMPPDPEALKKLLHEDDWRDP